MKKNAGNPGGLYSYITIFLFAVILNATIHFPLMAEAEETPLQKFHQISLTAEEKEWLTKHPVIRVGNSSDYTPINFLADGKPSGYAIDVINILAKRLNLRIEYVAETFSRQFQMILDKELDVLVSLLKTPQRAELLRLTQSYKSADAGIFVRHGEYIIQSIEDLSGKTVALTKGDANNAALQRAVPEADLIVTDSYLHALRMVASGKADATIQPIIVAGYLARENFLSNLKIVGGIQEFDKMGYRVQEYHIGVRRDWPELAAIFDKALQSVTKAEWQELDNRWMGMSRDGAVINFSAEEKAWLAEHPVVRVGTDPDWGPIEFRDKKGNYTGLVIDYLKKIEQLLGIRFEFVPENWQELIDRAKKQEIDIFSCVAKTPEREEYLIFTEPYITMPTGVFAKEVVSFISDISMLAGRKIAVVDSYAIHDHIKVEYSEVNLLLVKNPPEGIQAVLEGKAFAYVDNAVTTGHLLNRKGIKNINFSGEVDFEFAQRIGVRKDWPIFTGILQKAIDTIPEAELNAMYNQWVPLTSEKPVDYSLLWKILGSALIIIIFFVWGNIRLRVAVKERTGELSASEERFRTVVEQSISAIEIYRPDGMLILVNDAWVNFWNLEKESVKSFNFFDDPQRENAGLTPAFREAQQGNATIIPEMVYEPEKSGFSGGRKRWISPRMYPIKDKADVVQRIILTYDDISEQKRAEKERENLQDQLVQAQKMESVGRLAGGVAHDFNNMLTIILGNVEILIEDLDPANPLNSNLKEVQKAAQRSIDLTRQLLAFARKQTISPKILDLNSTIEGMLKMLRRLIGEDIDLSWHPMKKVWPVKIDPSQVDQILANLCVNARDSIEDVGKISIETDNVSFDEEYSKNHPEFKPGEYIMLAVSDNGCGMDKETLNNLFEPFFTTKEPGEGTGLGLAMIYGIVRQNNGFINVYSEVEQGTTFKIYIPRYTEDIELEKQVPDEAKIQKGHETILLVEDEKAILDMTKMMLERLGYTVLAANTPEQAMQIGNTSETQIHLLMTDVVMPSMNGRDLSEKILQLYPKMKCLFMSGYTANVIAHRGILDEGLNFIGKPFSKKDLSVKLRDILDVKHN